MRIDANTEESISRAFGRNIKIISELGETGTFENGDKVICSSDYENNWGGCDPIKGNLEVGNIYTIKTVEVHSWHTKIYLEEFPDKVFNSVHFEKISKEE